MKEIKLIELDDSFSREGGIKAKSIILAALGSNEKVILNFSGESFTPSFLDECLGLLAQEIGINSFSNKLVFKEMSELTDKLVRKIIANRIQQLKSI